MPSSVTIRSATRADLPVIFEMIRSLADYEQLSHLMTGQMHDLGDHLFGDQPYAKAVLAERAGTPVGYALYFFTYSTFLTQPSLYLEDLFVLPAHRQQGIGKALIVDVAQRAIAANCGRMEWSVLDWNETAIGFYQSLGATVLPDWRICRLMADHLKRLTP